MNAGETYRHKTMSHLTIELVAPTNRGWKVIERNAAGNTKQRCGVTKYYYLTDFRWFNKI